MIWDKSVVPALIVSLLILPASALAEKGGKHGHHEEDVREGHHNDSRRVKGSGSRPIGFTSEDRRTISGYYGEQVRAGKCPPGLSKKGKGCLPPGQAKKWVIGRPLPSEIDFRELPRDLLVRLPAPPREHRYVQVAGDILMVALGSSMIVDAIQDILL